MQSKLSDECEGWRLSDRAVTGLTALSVCLSASGFSALAIADDEVYAIEERFEAEEEDGKIVVLEFDAQEVAERKVADDAGEDPESEDSEVVARHEYSFETERENDRLSIAIQNEGEDGEEIVFVYDQAINKVSVNVDEDELQVNFVEDDGLVAIGDQDCQPNDYTCIVKAAREVFPGLEPEDVAALDFALDEELDEMEEGYQIRLVFNLLSDELAE